MRDHVKMVGRFWFWGMLGLIPVCAGFAYWFWTTLPPDLEQWWRPVFLGTFFYLTFGVLWSLIYGFLYFDARKERKRRERVKRFGELLREKRYL